MRQFLSNKLTIVALVVMVLSVVTGVTWASTSNQTTNSAAEIQALNLKVVEGGNVEIAGAGFIPDETVFFQIFRGEAELSLSVQGGVANAAGAFSGSITLPAALKADADPKKNVFTVRALIQGGGVAATTPLILVAKKP